LPAFAHGVRDGANKHDEYFLYRDTDLVDRFAHNLVAKFQKRMISNPFALSLSKGLIFCRNEKWGFDKLSPNGVRGTE
jgi:hypothetical protein